MSLGHLNTLSPGMAAQVALHAAALTVSLRPPVVTCNSRGMSLYSNFLAGVLLSLLFSVMTVVEFHSEADEIQ